MGEAATERVVVFSSTGEAETSRLHLEFERFKHQGIDVSAFAGGLAAALAGRDVETGAEAARNPAEHNGFAIPIMVGFYLTVASDGNPLEGLAKLGEGTDPLSQTITSTTTQAVEWSASNYSEPTRLVLQALDTANGAIDATNTYADEATGKSVSTSGNSLAPPTQPA